MEEATWFKYQNCSELEIYKYKSVSKDDLISTITIKEITAINSIREKIKSLPVNGDEKVSWSASSQRIVLSFKCEGENFEKVEIINRKIKTPTTGFLSINNKVESELVSNLESLLEPKLNQRILKIKDYVVKLKDFSIIFTGNKERIQLPGEPTIGTTNRHFFQVNENMSANSTILEIFDGQIPPQPQGFVVGKKIYYLITFQFKPGEDLYPHYFVISDKLPSRR